MAKHAGEATREKKKYKRLNEKNTLPGFEKKRKDIQQFFPVAGNTTKKTKKATAPKPPIKPAA